MGKRGPKPTPTEKLINRGSWRGKINKSEPNPTGTPSCPIWLSDEAKEVWWNIVPLLIEMNCATAIDSNAIARYCDVFVRWRNAAQWIQDKGEVYKDKNGILRRWPHVDIYKDTSVMMDRLEQSFGLTPSARTRIVTMQIEDKKQSKSDTKMSYFAQNA